MTRGEIAEQFSHNIEIERIKLGYTQAQMAKALDMSLSSYKNMITGISTNIPIYVAHKVYHITSKFLFELCGEDTPETHFLDHFRTLPSHTQQSLLNLVRLESELATENVHPTAYNDANLICLYTPTGNMTDGMIFDSANKEFLNVSKYRTTLGSYMDCAIRITSNHLHPVYHVGDILLICQQPPRDGDTGIFIHKPTMRIYIRKFYQTKPCRLEPLTNMGRTIYVDSTNPNDMNQWIKFGYVLTKYR